MLANEEKIKHLKKIIAKSGLITKNRQKIISPNGGESNWLFDLRNVFLNPEGLNLITDIFWQYFEKEYPFQVGGQEIAAIPLVSAIVLESQRKGKPINGFIIRKSRKPTGLQKLIEGAVDENKIILVDDLINSGSTILRQIKVLESVGKKVDTVFVLIRFRDENYYKFVEERGSKIISLFSLKDFNLSRDEKADSPPPQNFKIIWHFQSPEPNYFYRVPKSAPCLDEEKIYFGSDSGYFWALNQENGLAVWKFKVGHHVKGKTIFSSPAIYKDVIYFGAYDGNVYALDTASGKPKWVFREADWVGSSPAIAPDLNLLFIGLEFGLFKKRGGIVALDLKNGEKKWGYEMSEFVHCSPAYCPEKNLVAIGGNDFCVYLFDAKNGELKWKFKTGGEIKTSLIFDAERNLLLFGSFDKHLYALDIDSGELKGKYKTEEIIYSTPTIHKDSVVFSSLDKNIYSLNLKTGKLNWRFSTNGRIFASPIVIENKIYIGSNDGKLYEINAETGKLIDFFQATERITNKIAYNSETKRFFVPTYANEIYCVAKIKEGQ